MASCHDGGRDEITANLTPNRRRVLQQLQHSERPLSAYELLECLRQEGTNWQPPTAYRALDYLVEQGLAHYLQSIQKYVVCPHSGCSHFSQLLICVECGQVQEVAMTSSLLAALQQQADEQNFRLSAQFLELKGVCGRCRDAAVGTE
ncbi:Fur family transcriptional regulator [Pseudaeromonas sharmana]|uniref:Fur family transcriptional regulator n=1 Tax=Pseudaeromonas sharmana TaxID=328412 RepID=A0ABV8CM33_9GAMM